MRPTYVSLRWSEEKSFGGRAFYKHLAPNGAKGNNVLFYFQVEFTNLQTKYFSKNVTLHFQVESTIDKPMNETIRSFINCINAHDVDGLGRLMSDNHTFIDAHGNEIVGKEKMAAGWRGYFEWFPDYYIEVTDVFDAGGTFALFGFAGGSFKGKESESWRLPAAWKAIVKDGRVALWQVFADTKIPFEIISRNT